MMGIVIRLKNHLSSPYFIIKQVKSFFSGTSNAEILQYYPGHNFRAVDMQSRGVLTDA